MDQGQVFRLEPGFDFLSIMIVHCITPQCAMGLEVPNADVLASVWQFRVEDQTFGGFVH